MGKIHFGYFFIFLYGQGGFQTSVWFLQKLSDFLNNLAKCPPGRALIEQLLIQLLPDVRVHLQTFIVSVTSRKKDVTGPLTFSQVSSMHHYGRMAPGWPIWGVRTITRTL